MCRLRPVRQRRMFEAARGAKELLDGLRALTCPNTADSTPREAH